MVTRPSSAFGIEKLYTAVVLDPGLSTPVKSRLRSSYTGRARRRRDRGPWLLATAEHTLGGLDGRVRGLGGCDLLGDVVTGAGRGLRARRRCCGRARRGGGAGRRLVVTAPARGQARHQRQHQ